MVRSVLVHTERQIDAHAWSLQRDDLGARIAESNTNRPAWIFPRGPVGLAAGSGLLCDAGLGGGSEVLDRAAAGPVGLLGLLLPADVDHRLVLVRVADDAHRLLAARHLLRLLEEHAVVEDDALV